MTLGNLVGMSLERIEPDPGVIRRLLDSAQRNIQDAYIEAVSNENRFDAAYKANRVSKKWHDRIEMNAAELRREKDKERSILKQKKTIQAYAEELCDRRQNQRIDLQRAADSH